MEKGRGSMRHRPAQRVTVDACGAGPELHDSPGFGEPKTTCLGLGWFDWVQVGSMCLARRCRVQE